MEGLPHGVGPSGIRQHHLSKHADFQTLASRHLSVQLVSTLIVQLERTFFFGRTRPIAQPAALTRTLRFWFYPVPQQG